MFGFVRKREVEELRARMRLCEDAINLIREHIGFLDIAYQYRIGEASAPRFTRILDDIIGIHPSWVRKIETGEFTTPPEYSISQKIEMLLKYLGLNVVPERVEKSFSVYEAYVAPIKPKDKPPAKANKRTAKKANGGDEESGK